jgi:hypothetical protein
MATPNKPYSTSGITPANGILELHLTPPSTYYWNVTQITVTCSGVAESIANVYVDQNYYCGTASGNGDSADGSPLIVANGRTLRVIWAGADVGSTCTVNVLVEETQVGR